MTTVGKILVFVNLVFSLVVGALAVFVYVPHTNYVLKVKEQIEYRQLDRANMEAYKAQVEEVKAEMQVKVDQEKAAIKRVQDDLAALVLVNKDLADQREAEKQKAIRSEANLKAAQVEVARRQESEDNLKKTIKEEIAKNLDMVKQIISFRDRTTGAEIQSRAALVRNRELETQLQDMARDIARIRANVGTTTTVAKNAKNPPPENIDGLVKAADNKDGLFHITLGSDAGLLRGHTMEVFRLNTSNPTQSRYLGTIKIIEVTAHEAVGTPLGGKMVAPVQAGDTVASRIIGG
jgi:hypothetical protein